MTMTRRMTTRRTWCSVVEQMSTLQPVERTMAEQFLSDLKISKHYRPFIYQASKLRWSMEKYGNIHFERS
ncbi:hypothetical protein GRJ2_001559500 [Grus japonensis]|uniref:Uncharacterized protein n=1 Tax=Grus japonensis TaxID=30415 RepID=A0ABC9X232_GRUJA